MRWLCVPDSLPQVDVFRSLLNLLKVIPDILLNFVPYALVLAVFGAFVVWNGGIVLGECHCPSHSRVHEWK